MEKGAFVSDIQGGDHVRGVFLVREKQLRKARTGKDYLALVLMDRSGEIGGRVWERAAELSALFDVNDYVAVEANAEVFREEVQLNIREMVPVEQEGVDPGDFMPVSPYDREGLWNEFVQMARRVKTPPLALLMEAVCKDGGLSQAIRTAPAAKRLHHAYIGGLLEHSVSVGRLAAAVCRLYPGLDEELLTAGALLHDLGKTEELDYSTPNFGYTDRGRLLGHIGIGIEMLDRIWSSLGLPAGNERFLQLKHMVLSHHGQREMGSPVLPMTEEAVVLHFIDDMDAKLNFLSSLGSGLDGPGRAWTDYQALFGRYFFLTPRGERCGEDAEEQGSEDGGGAVNQQSLWKELP